MHKVTITKNVNGATVIIEAEGTDALYIVGHKITMIEELLDSHIFNQKQGNVLIEHLTKDEFESMEGQTIRNAVSNHAFPVKIPKTLSHLYHDERPF